MAERILIVNGDDFGQSPAINRGIAVAHRAGILTSASLMVRFPAAGDAAAYGRDNPDLSVGLHVDLGEWSYRNGRWEPEYVVVDDTNPQSVRAELERQLDRFSVWMGRPPTHLDSHQHAHRQEPLGSLLIEWGERLGVPVRDRSSLVRHEGGFHGQAARGRPMRWGIQVEHLIALLRALPPGVTELGCHPADAVDLVSMYGDERVQELSTLCDPRVREAIRTEGIRLRSFHGLPASLTA